LPFLLLAFCLTSSTGRVSATLIYSDIFSSMGTSCWCILVVGEPLSTGRMVFGGFVFIFREAGCSVAFTITFVDTFGEGVLVGGTRTFAVGEGVLVGTGCGTTGGGGCVGLGFGAVPLVDVTSSVFVASVAPGAECFFFGLG